jgi:biopolymer transport protein ExbB
MKALTGSAFGASPSSLGLAEALGKGGPVIWLIFLCSVVALAVSVERWWYYRRCQVNVSEFLTGIVALVQRGRYEEALARCADAWGPVSHTVRQALLCRELPPSELREMTREAALTWLPSLEAHLPLLATVAMVAPLLGFFGTVLAMMQTFYGLSQVSPAASSRQIAEGVWSCLVATGCGLGVAIPAVVAYNLLLQRLYRITDDIERAMIEVVHALVLAQTRPDSSSNAAGEPDHAAAPVRGDRATHSDH